MRTSEVIVALEHASRIIRWESEMIEAYHEYGQAFGGTPGDNVFRFVLEQALSFRGTTIDQFMESRKDK
jgi:hypothetical protein